MTNTPTIATIMTRSTYCVRPDASVQTVASLMLELRLGGLPVVDEDGKPVGVVSKTDVLRHQHERGDAETVRDIMMPLIFAVRPETPIARAAALMAGEGVHRLAIVDGDNTVVGIVSALDIVRWVAEQGGYSI
jgi:CBS domain-containing protein